MKSFKKSIAGKSRPRGRPEADAESEAINQGSSVARSSSTSDVENKVSVNSLSDKHHSRWGSKWWSGRQKSAEGSTIKPSNDSKISSQGSHKAATIAQGRVDPDTREATREYRREKGILITENVIEIIGVVKVAADTTSVAGPLKATCGITERILITVKAMLQNDAAWDDLVQRMDQYLAILTDQANIIESKGSESRSLLSDENFLSSLVEYLGINSEAERKKKVYRNEEFLDLAAQAQRAKLDTETIQDLASRLDDALNTLLSKVYVDLRGAVGRMSSQVDQSCESRTTIRMVYLLGLSIVLRLLPNVDARGLRSVGLEPGTRRSLINRLTQWALDTDPYQQVFWLSDEAGTGKTTLAAYMADKWQTYGILAGRFFFNRDDPDTNNLQMFSLGLAKDIADLHPQSHSFLLEAFRANPGIDVQGFENQFQHLVAQVLTQLQSVLQHPLVVVLDALDECEVKAREQFTFALTHSLPASGRIKVFLTSRREVDIDDALRDAPNVCGKDAHLLDIHSTSRDDDISVYVHRVLHQFNREQRQTVIECARGHFLWASLACSALLMTPSPTPILQRMKGMEPGDTLRHLYEAVLNSALSDKESLQLLKYVLQAIALAFRPISIFTMERFNPPDPQNQSPSYVQTFVERLGSLMKDGTIYLPVHTLHPSFQQFLKEQTQEAKFYLEPDVGHARIARIWAHYIPESRMIAEYVEEPPKVLEEVWEMPLSQHFLAWVEWASALRELGEGLTSLILLRKHLRILSLLGAFEHLDSKLERWGEDVVTFLQNNQANIQRRPDHVHTSALTFTPPQSLIHQRYFKISPMELPIVLNQPALHPFTHRTLGGLWNRVITCEFSPDGQRFLTQTIGTDMHLWDAHDGTLIRHLEGNQGSISSSAFSNDGLLIASGGHHEKRVLVWDGHTGTLLLKLPDFHRQAITNVVFALDDTVIISCSDDCKMMRWPTTVDGYHRPPREIFEDATRHIPAEGLVVSPNRRVVSVWYKDGVLMLFDPQSLSSLGSRKADDGLSSAIFSYDGSKIIGGSNMGRVYIWDVMTDTTFHVLKAHDRSIYELAVCSDRTTLAVLAENIQMWNIHTGKELSSPLTAYTGSATSISFSRRGRRLISATSKGTIQVWNLLQNGSNLSADGFPLKGHTACIDFVRVSPDGRKIVSFSTEDSTLRMWDLGDNLDLDGREPDPPKGKIECMNYSRDGTAVLCGSNEGTLTLYDSNTGKIIGRKMSDNNGKVTAIQFSSRVDVFAAGYQDGVIKICNEAKEPISSDFIGHEAAIIDVEFSLTGSLLASSSRDNSIIIWVIDLDKITGIASKRVDVASLQRGAAFSANEKYLAYLSKEALHLYSLMDESVVSTSTKTDPLSIDHLCFSSDGNTLLRSNKYGAELYDLHQGNELFCFAQVKERMKYRAALTEDGECIYVNEKFGKIAGLSRTTLQKLSPMGRVRRGDPSPLPPFIFHETLPHIVPLRELNLVELEPYLCLPTDLRVEQWLVHTNQLALALHDGTLMFVRIPLDFIHSILSALPSLALPALPCSMRTVSKIYLVDEEDNPEDPFARELNGNDAPGACPIPVVREGESELSVSENTTSTTQFRPRGGQKSNLFTTKPRGKPAMEEKTIKEEYKVLVERIKASEFYKTNEMEPTIGSKEGLAILDVLRHETIYKKSIYWILVDEPTKICLLCGIHRVSQERAMSCVRSDLGHKPFCCPGMEAGCKKCGPEPYRPHARFSSKALLDDHIRNQAKKQRCIECKALLRRDGLRRHWAAKHGPKEFPEDAYPRTPYIPTRLPDES
ncbi:WD40 repeat-like protein [Serendipita vermifera]|nr:WD40 repeat-like protein [Serendipita vermifera]